MKPQEAAGIEEKIADLKTRLKDLQGRNPAHCSDKNTYIGHQMTQKVFEEMEDLEDQIKDLESQLKEQ